MPTNPYFRNYSPTTTSEQAMLEDNIIELVQVHGVDVYYIVRESEEEEDPIIGEDPRSKYTRVYPMEMFPDAYMGGNDFAGKFGLQIPETMILRVARKTFERYVPGSVALRPREGDLIYLPVQRKLYEVMFTEEDESFFALGRFQPYVYKMNCELFRYNQQKIATGVPEVDRVDDNNAYGIDLTLGNGSGNFIYSEEVYQGANLSVASAKGVVRDWNPSNKTIDIIYINGTFATGSNVKGATSGAEYSFTTAHNPLDESIEHDEYPNADYESQANSLYVRTETNPFGTP